MVTAPKSGAIHRYHTEAPPACPAWLGSIGSLVAFTLVPLTMPAVMIWALANMSFGGVAEVRAEAMRIRRLVIPFRESVMGTPVAWRVPRMVVTEADGDACFRMAQAPATWGAAIEVPTKPE